ncbi:MAG: hypothetical protein ACXWUS_11285 [Burkholderiales bacterium]
MAARWGFAKAGTLGWGWKVADEGTIVTRRSVRNFQTLEDCVQDAIKHGYVLETPTAAACVVKPAEAAESTQSSDATLAGSTPAKAMGIRRVDPIAIYADAEGDIILRQQCVERLIDTIVTIPAEDAYTMIEAMQRHLETPLVAHLKSAPQAAALARDDVRSEHYTRP